ncbi:RdgB/HAM1 family non-canonical purine NTP pyrophosphatase [Chitinispirillales bacterium ANBcel5]|uniref:RdgB/HAM1 family non-canonical purine NTP pyrophosphatase n=1 Tax=Cellulosispirillum alkaliphilum TaxID=3039283 RepID=UPI002A57BA9A|nr:RdgB/HAM1 family non-canonical purine NTP pyrophosphatase [Chitinispirillales bacterium ANBcel5]
MEIILATGNEGKVREFREMFSKLPVHLTSLKDHWDPVPAIDEYGLCFYENAKIKADWVFERTQGVWALADDSGLEVDALNGAPGVKSARFAGEKAMSKENNQKLLSLLEGIPDEKRTARFRCVLVLKIAQDQYLSAESTCEGQIAHEGTGEMGFGYDPVFIPEGSSVSLANYNSEKKHMISHRGKALKILKKVLYGYFGEE